MLLCPLIKALQNTRGRTPFLWPAAAELASQAPSEPHLHTGTALTAFGTIRDTAHHCCAWITGTTTNKDMFRGWELPKKRPTVGIAMVGDQQHVLIPSTLTVPCHGKQIFTTVHDNQPHMSFVIYAGESRVASSNKQLGQFQLKGVPSAPFGVPQIEVQSPAFGMCFSEQICCS